MAFKVETLAEQAARARAAFAANLPGVDAWLWPNNIGPTAKVMAELGHSILGRLEYVERQAFTLTADRDGLIAQGDELGLPILPPAAATGTATFAADGAITVAAGAILQRGDGVQYRVTNGGGRLTAGDLDLTIVAVTTGATTNALAGTALAAVSGVTGTTTIAVDDGGLTGGADVEDTEAYRDRILWRKRNPPHGGALADYVTWCRAIPGVTRVFVEDLYAGRGTVRIYPLMDGAMETGVPSSASLAAIQAQIDALKPGGKIATVAAATPQPIDIAVTGLLPATTAMQEAVRRELAAMMLRRSRVAGGATPNAALPFLATPYSFSRSWIWQAIANTSGEESHSVTLPSADVPISAGAIPVLGTVTFA